MKNKGLLKNTIFYSIGEVLPRVIGFLLLPVYTRYLSPADYGIMSYTQSVIVFLYVLGSFALNTFTLRFYFDYKDETKRKTLLGTIHISIVFFNIIILLLAFLIMPRIINNYSLQVPWNPYFRLAFLINFFDSFTIIPMIVYRVRQEAIKFVGFGLTRSICTVCLTLYLLVVKGQGLIGSYHAQLYVIMIYAFIYLFVINKYGKWKFDITILKEGLNYSLPLIPGVICYQMLSVSDRIILERNVSVDELGIYNIACILSLALNIVIQSGYKSVEPEIFKRYGQDGFYPFVKKAQSLFLFVVFVGAFILSMFAQEVFFLMTSPSFYGGYFLVPLVVIGVILTGQNVFYGVVLQGEKRTKIQGAATVVGAAISLILNLMFIPQWGVYAAAVTSGISYFVMNIILFKSMTFPGKTVIRELLLIILIPILSFMFYSIFSEISYVSILLKTTCCLFYILLSIAVLKIDTSQIKNNFVNYKKL